MTAEASQQGFSVAEDTSWSVDRPHTLKSDDCFAIFGRFGDMEADAEGVYYRDTRHLSQLSVMLNNARPRLLSSAIKPDNSALLFDLGMQAAIRNTDMGDDGNEILLRRESFLWRNMRHDRLNITNWSSLPQKVTISISFNSDFADLFEIRGTKRARRGTLQIPVCDGQKVTMACLGLDGETRSTSVGFEPRPDSLKGGLAVYAFEIPAGGQREVTLAIQCGDEAGAGLDAPAAAGTFTIAQQCAQQRNRTRRCAVAWVTSGNIQIDSALRRSRDDLLMLTTQTEYGPYPYAGVPWFSTAFGRDAIITSLQVLWSAPDLARGVLQYLAANQATEINQASDAEPGKILHEARDGDMARSGEVPFRRYYGSVDSTPLFLMLAGAYFDRTGDLEFAAKLWPHVEAALNWMDHYGDADGDGFVEYGRQSADGLVNQGWKDSRDSIFHEDGALAVGPIALCEVQAYVFAAKLAAGKIAGALGMSAQAEALRAQAKTLRARFDAAFWDDALGFYVLALDGKKKPCRVLASNAGHALFAGIALPERAAKVADLLMTPAFFSGWGIRTIAEGQKRFNPMSYHNGSVWPHDNALIGIGFGRYGRRQDAARLFDAMLATAVSGDHCRLPELFCGLARAGSCAPTSYPVACAPQAWAAGALPALLNACIGIEFDAQAGFKMAESPVLPSGIQQLRVRNLDAGGRKLAFSMLRDAQGK